MQSPSIPLRLSPNGESPAKSLDDRKYKITQELIKTDDEALIVDLEQRLAQKQERDFRNEIWDKVIKPMRKNISVEELARSKIISH